MEHYRKSHSSYIGDHPRPNELRITGAGKAHDLSTKAAAMLKVSRAAYRGRARLVASFVPQMKYIQKLVGN